MTRQHQLRFAGSAIAAALVLGTTPAFAQDAEAVGTPPITIVVPQPSAAPVPVPAAAPAAQIESPVVSTAQDDLRAAAPSPQSAAERSVQRNRTAVAPRTAVSAPIAAASATSSQAVADAAPAAVLPAAVEAAPIAGAEPVATSDNGSADEVLLGAGLLAALGLGGLALAMTRRRRVKRTDVQRETPPVDITPHAAAIEPTRAPVAQRAPAPQWTSPAAFALPAVVPEDMQARRALIERMVSAQPDAANPFKSRKARTRRARLILAHRTANQRPVLEDRLVTRPAATVAANPHREFEQA